LNFILPKTGSKDDKFPQRNVMIVDVHAFTSGVLLQAGGSIKRGLTRSRPSHPTHIPHTVSTMANYDANYNPNADPAFDGAPYEGGENSEDYDADATCADPSLKTAAREDRDAAKTDSHERPSQCVYNFNSAHLGLD
jgi:hypothetical protein